jgi:lipopolysaccharide biosynthesis glycosyltransferase
MLTSLVDRNPGLDFLLHLITDDKNLVHKANKIYNNIVFHPVDVNKYIAYNKPNARFWSMEAFNIDADKVIFLDSDMVCMQNIAPIINHECKFGMVREQRRPSYNAGLMVIGKQYLSNGTYECLLSKDYSDVEMYGNDQKSYNLFFAGAIEELPVKYNTLVTEYDARERPIFLHYIHKPYHPVGRQFYENKPGLVQIWEGVKDGEN